MCYEHFHDCKYCSIHYQCVLPNKECPTVNFDVDMKMCIDCRKNLEILVEQFTFDEAMIKLRELNNE